MFARTERLDEGGSTSAKVKRIDARLLCLSAWTISNAKPQPAEPGHIKYKIPIDFPTGLVGPDSSVAV